MVITRSDQRGKEMALKTTASRRSAANSSVVSWGFGLDRNQPGAYRSIRQIHRRSPMDSCRSGRAARRVPMAERSLMAFVPIADRHHPVRSRYRSARHGPGAQLRTRPGAFHGPIRPAPGAQSRGTDEQPRPKGPGRVCPQYHRRRGRDKPAGRRTADDARSRPEETSWPADNGRATMGCQT